MANDPVSRREALRSALLFGAAAMAPAVLAGCGKKELTCTDTSGLSQSDLQMRTALQYVDKSPEAGKECDNCAQFEPAGADKCGACKIVKGPISPKGYCKSWSQKT
jgi:hypothetical protein